MALPGAIQQVTSSTQGNGGGLSALAGSIVSAAAEFQPTASGTRLTAKPLNRNLQAANKARAIQQEHSGRREAGNLTRRLAGLLWHFPAPDVKGTRKDSMKPVGPFYLYSHTTILSIL